MADAKLRHAIAFEAARLMYDRVESEYFTAKIKAAKRLCKGYVKTSGLPSNAEIRDLIQQFARIYEGDRRTDNLLQMRLAALRIMKLLCKYRPRLIGSVMTGHTRDGSDIDLHLFADSVQGIEEMLQAEGLPYEVERKQITKHGESRIFTHVHVYDTFNFELTVYSESQCHYVFKSSITGKAIERASIAELEQLMTAEYPEVDLDDPDMPDDAALELDPFPLYRIMLLALENVKQSPKWHPEGNALYHTLQVFEKAREVRFYDEEFLLAALLHDAGKAIDPFDHVGAALQALHGLISERTSWLIQEHMTAHEYVAGTLGARHRKRLESDADFEDLLLLQECDVGGRVPGANVGTVDEALEFVRELAQQNGES